MDKSVQVSQNLHYTLHYIITYVDKLKDIQHNFPCVRILHHIPRCLALHGTHHIALLAATTSLTRRVARSSGRAAQTSIMPGLCGLRTLGHTRIPHGIVHAVSRPQIEALQLRHDGHLSGALPSADPPADIQHNMSTSCTANLTLSYHKAPINDLHGYVYI